MIERLSCSQTVIIDTFQGTQVENLERKWHKNGITIVIKWQED